MLFVCHEKGNIDLIATINLETFLDILTNNNEFYKGGWNLLITAILYYIKKIAPSLQTKAPVKIRDMIKNYRDNFQIIYEKLGEISQ